MHPLDAPKPRARARGAEYSSIIRAAPGAGSSRQTGTALGATASEHAAATDRLHPLPEAVTALANDLARLVRTFHGSVSVDLESRSEIGPGRLTA